MQRIQPLRERLETLGPVRLELFLEQLLRPRRVFDPGETAVLPDIPLGKILQDGRDLQRHLSEDYRRGDGQTSSARLRVRRILPYCSCMEARKPRPFALADCSPETQGVARDVRRYVRGN